jgi:hypothetical protein
MLRVDTSGSLVCSSSAVSVVRLSALVKSCIKPGLRHALPCAHAARPPRLGGATAGTKPESRLEAEAKKRAPRGVLPATASGSTSLSLFPCILAPNDTFLDLFFGL